MRRWYAGAVAAVLAMPLGIVASCSSSSQPPPELEANYDASSKPDQTVQEASTPDVSESGPDVYEAGPDGDADAGDGYDAPEEPACTPIGDGGVTVTSTSLTFGQLGDGGLGLVGCGTQATPQSVTLTNDSCVPFTFTATLTSGSSFYSITAPASGTVAPGQSQPVQVAPNPIPQTSAVTPDLYEGTLSITTSAPGDSAHIVQLHMTAYGAIIQSNQFGQTLDFGGVAIGQTAQNQFSVTNTGNAPAMVSFAVGSQYFTVTPSFTISANQPVSPQVTFKPTNVQVYNDTITTTVAPGTPLCSTPPPTTPLKGTGTTGIAVAPTNLDFGLVQCQQPAAAFQTTTITNTGAATTYTLTFVKGANSPYTLADNTGAPLTPGVPINLAQSSSATIRIVPIQIPNPATTAADGYADTLTITTTSSGDAPHNVALHETAQGTIFTLQPASISDNVNPGTTKFENFTVGNTGNLAAGYTLATATTPPGPANTFTSNLLSGNLGPNTTENGVLYFNAPPIPEGGAAMQYLGTLTLTPNTGTVLCADPPPPMPLSLTN